MTGGGAGMLFFTQVASFFLPLLVWTVVLGVGAVILPRSKPSGALVIGAAALALGVLLLNAAGALGLGLVMNSSVNLPALQTFLLAKEAGTVLVMSLVHVMLLMAVFVGRDAADTKRGDVP